MTLVFISDHRALNNNLAFLASLLLKENFMSKYRLFIIKME